MKKIFHTALIILLAAAGHAQNESGINKHYLGLELDPAPFVLGGYSFSLKYSPSVLPKFALTASIYSSPLPDKMMGKSNYESGFNQLKIERSYAVFADYFFRNDRSGFYFGPSLFFYNKSVNHGLKRLTFSSLYSNVRIGYVYKPFKDCGLYLNPWINVGHESIITNGDEFEGATYTTPALSYIVALHVGYQVTF